MRALLVGAVLALAWRSAVHAAQIRRLGEFTGAWRVQRSAAALESRCPAGCPCWALLGVEEEWAA